MSENRVIVVSAPSGTGKTTLNRRLVNELDQLELSVSSTTRKIRPGELNGDHYWFVSSDTFQQLIDHDRMVEWANVFGNLYGTSKDEIGRIQSKGHSPLLEIDVQGWHQTRSILPHAVAIFILPPSIRALWDRLATRGTDDLATRWRRLNTAREELNHANIYTHFVINDDLEQAYTELHSLITDSKAPALSHAEGIAWSKRLIKEFEEASWLQEIRKSLPELESE